MLLELMKLNNISVSQLAKELNVATSQIYKWNREGILESNPYFPRLKRRFPSLLPKKPKITQKGIEDKRNNNGRPKKELILRDTNVQTPKEKKFKSELLPNITIRKKNT